MIHMSTIDVRVDKETYRKMKLLSHIDWNETARQAINTKIAEEEAKRRLDPNMLKEAAKMTDKIRKTSPSWNSTKEIRKWRNHRK